MKRLNQWRIMMKLMFKMTRLSVKTAWMLVLFVVGCTSTPVKEGSKDVAQVSLIHQSNRWGMLEPCGCSFAPYGGLDREMNAVSMFRKTPNKAFFYVDSGNAFVPMESKLKVKVYQDKSKGIVEMLNKMQLDVLSPGPQDYKMGIAHLQAIAQSARFPFVSTNVLGQDGKPLFKSHVILEKNGVKIAFISATPALSQVEGVTVKPVDEFLSSAISEVRPQADMVVLLSQLGSKEDDRLARVIPVDVIVGADPNLSSTTAFSFQKGKALLVESSNQGFRLGKLDIELKRPLQGFNSDEQIKENLEMIAAAEVEAKKHPKDKALQEYADKLRATRLVSPIEGGSTYSHSLINLDKQRFGGKNEITQMISQEKATVRKRALGE